MSVKYALMIGVSSCISSSAASRLSCVGMAVRHVDQHADPQRERARALGERLLGQQHAPHVGMHDDRVGRARWRSSAR